MAASVPPAPVPDGWYRHPVSGCLIPDTDADRAMHEHARGQRLAHHRRQPISAEVQGNVELNKLRSRMEQELARFKSMNDAMEEKLRAANAPSARPTTAPVAEVSTAQGIEPVALATTTAPVVSEVSADQLEVQAENARLKARLAELEVEAEGLPAPKKKKAKK